MKLTAASNTNRPWTCLHFQKPSEGSLTKRAGLQASRALEIGKSRRNSCNSRIEIRYLLMVHTSRISQGKQTNLTSNNSAYTPERAASTDTLSVGPSREPEGTPSAEGTTSRARLSTDIGHRFTWSRTCSKAFRALPDQEGRKNLILKKKYRSE